MKRFVLFLTLSLSLVFCACGGGSKHDGSGQGSNKFVGRFTDEFGNRFELKDDYTGTLQFDRTDKVDTIKWSDGVNHECPFATIEWNGDPSYYYLRDGALYRHEDDMNQGRCAIKISYAD